GALHGPTTKSAPSHLSNQCTRTFAPKPAYAMRYWTERKLKPARIDIAEVVKTRAERYYVGQRKAKGFAIQGDSRHEKTFDDLDMRVRWIITSPPYYGMRTYIPDQWLRHWFVGGPSEVEYANHGQLDHLTPTVFADQLRAVWTNVEAVARRDARLVVR